MALLADPRLHSADVRVEHRTGPAHSATGVVGQGAHHVLGGVEEHVVQAHAQGARVALEAEHRRAVVRHREADADAELLGEATCQDLRSGVGRLGAVGGRTGSRRDWRSAVSGVGFGCGFGGLDFGVRDWGTGSVTGTRSRSRSDAERGVGAWSARASLTAAARRSLGLRATGDGDGGDSRGARSSRPCSRRTCRGASRGSRITGRERTGSKSESCAGGREAIASYSTRIAPGTQACCAPSRVLTNLLGELSAERLHLLPRRPEGREHLLHRLRLLHREARRARRPCLLRDPRSDPPGDSNRRRATARRGRDGTRSGAPRRTACSPPRSGRRRTPRSCARASAAPARA